ncbi:MAG: VOC family protein [Myxococcota bacterium]
MGHFSRALHHVALGARDVETVAAFYRDVFGLPEVTRHCTPSGELRSVWLTLGDSLLMIERTSCPPHRVEGVGAGPFLLALRCSITERESLEASLRQAGSTIEERSGFTSYARDPEGNRVAISHYPDPMAEVEVR